MSQRTTIEWCTATWNPLRGCSHVNAGCDNCYAERMAARFSTQANSAFGGYAEMKDGKPRWTGVVGVVDKKLVEPLSWKKPQTIFVNSMSDLFHPSLVNDTIAKIFGVMHTANWHRYIILTKRYSRLPVFFKWFKQWTMNAWPREYPHVQIGVSVSDQYTLDEAYPFIVSIDAPTRIISYEPALGPIEIGTWFHSSMTDGGKCVIDQVIAGSESGPGARPSDINWFRSVRDQCQSAGVDFFFKQYVEGNLKISLPILDGRQWVQAPEVAR